MPCFDGGKKANIDHVTYDKAHKGQRTGTTLYPPGTGAFSSPRDQSSQPSERIERPNTLWPSPSQYQTGTQGAMQEHSENTYTPYEPQRAVRTPTTMNNIATAFTNYESTFVRPQNPSGVEDLHREIREGRLGQTIPPWEDDRRPLHHPRHGGDGSFPSRPQKPPAQFLPNNEMRPAPPRPDYSSQVRSPKSSMPRPGMHPPISYAQAEKQSVSTKKKRSNSFRDKFANGVGMIRAAGVHVKEVFTPRGKNQVSPGRTDSDLSDESFACQGDPKDIADRNERDTNARAVAAFQAEKYLHKKDPPRNLKVETPTGPSSQPLSPRSCVECRISLVKGMRTLCYPCERRLKTPKHLLTSTGSGFLPSDYLVQGGRDPPISPISPIDPAESQTDHREVRDFARPLGTPPRPPPPRKDYLTQSELEIRPIPPLKDLKYTKHAPVAATALIEPRVNISAAERFEEEDVIYFEPYRRWKSPEQGELFDLEMEVGSEWDSHLSGSEAEGCSWPSEKAVVEKESRPQGIWREENQRKTKFHEHLDD